MLNSSLRPISRVYCCTPSCFEKAAGRASASPKSPVRVTFAPSCFGTGRAREGRQVRRDDSRLEIVPMYTPKKETPQPGQAWGVGQHKDDTGNYASPASTLIAEADAIATSIPYMMTRERKRSAVSRFLGLWLQALAVSREGTV